MTTSRETDWMDHPRIRKLLTESNELTLSERLTLVKGLVPAIANEMSASDFDAFITELRMKGARYYEAKDHPGEGRAQRQTPGERELEKR